MATDDNLTGLQGVQKLQNILHAKAKEEPNRRFHALIDKVWRMDFLTQAWKQVRQNGGVPGIDRETFEDIDSYGVEKWLGELSRDLRVNDQKTQCLRCPDEAIVFLGYRLGLNYRRNGTGAYIGTRPSKASVQGICRKISEQTVARFGLMASEDMVLKLNRMLSGWANYYHLGQVSPAYSAIDAHTTKRLRQWLTRKHKLRSGNYVQFSSAKLWEQYGLVQLALTTKGFAWAKA